AHPPREPGARPERGAGPDHRRAREEGSGRGGEGPRLQTRRGVPPADRAPLSDPARQRRPERLARACAEEGRAESDQRGPPPPCAPWSAKARAGFSTRSAVSPASSTPLARRRGTTFTSRWW